MAGNAVATTGGGSLLERAKQGINPYLDDAGSDDFFGTFLKFSGNSGDYTYGDDYAEELPDGSELLLNGDTIGHGWICWVEGEVMAEINHLVSSGKTLPKESSLEDFGPYTTHPDGTKDGWQEQYILHLYSEKTDEAFTLKLSSASARRSAQKLVREYGKNYMKNIAADGESFDIPVIEIGNTSFDVKNKDGTVNKKAGKKYAPLFKIVDWAPREEVIKLFEGLGDGSDEDDGYEEADEAPVAEKATGSRRAAKEEPEDKPARGSRREAAPADEDKPARGSRRAAREEASADDGDSDDGDAGDQQEEAPATGGGRRTRVVHAEPQDDGDADGDARSNPRESARGRRGRSRG